MQRGGRTRSGQVCGHSRATRARCSTTASVATTRRVRPPGRRSSATWSGFGPFGCARAGRGGVAGPATRRSSAPRSSGCPNARASTPTEWALGIEARVRALLSDGDAADRSTASRSSASAAPACASSSPARTCSTANGCGARPGESTRASSCAPRTRCSRRWAPTAFADRARARAAWPRARRSASARVETRDELTAQEAQIARLARDGLLEPGDRRPAVHQPAHRRVPPAQGLHQARHHARAASSTASCPATPPPPRSPSRGVHDSVVVGGGCRRDFIGSEAVMHDHEKQGGCESERRSIIGVEYEQTPDEGAEQHRDDRRGRGARSSSLGRRRGASRKQPRSGSGSGRSSSDPQPRVSAPPRSGSPSRMREGR